jgi:hypothetical protein
MKDDKKLVELTSKEISTIYSTLIAFTQFIKAEINKKEPIEKEPIEKEPIEKETMLHANNILKQLKLLADKFEKLL